MSSSKAIIQELFSEAGVTINGDKPWDITVHNEKFYNRLIHNAELALGESYMDKWWDCKSIDQFVYKVLTADLETKALQHPKFWRSLVTQKIFETILNIFNFQTVKKAFVVGQKHYDAGNELFKAMLDKKMIYTDGLWKDATNLEESQEDKLKLVCKKLNLEPNMRVLDIGCGWGGFAKYAVENYGVSVVGITVSEEQVELAKNKTKDLPIEIRLQDYRDLTNKKEKFDRVVSLGMFEHVGYKNYDTYMNVVLDCLQDDGIFIMSTICANSVHKNTSPWIFKYIFPNGQIPTVSQISTAAENVFIIEDAENFGLDYDKTLMAWYQNINQHWSELKDYNETFQRMWNYYLLSCAGSFRARKNQLWQFVFSKNGLKEGFHY